LGGLEIAKSAHRYIIECDGYAPSGKSPKSRALINGLGTHKLAETRVAKYTMSKVIVAMAPAALRIFPELHKPKLKA